MGKVWLFVAVVAGSILIGSVWFVPIITGAHMGGGMMGPGMMGSGMMGPGMMGPREQQRPGYGDYSNWQQMQEECMEMMEHMRG